MFINISNHPSCQWDEKQLSQALVLGGGKILDIQFPNVSPTDHGKMSKYVNQILDDIPLHKDGLTFHIMGESGLVYQLVSLLIDKYDIYHSTSQRVTEEVDGVKVSKFKFVQFRKYI